MISVCLLLTWHFWSWIVKSEYHTMLSLYVCQKDSKLFYLPYKDWKLVAIIVAEFTRGHKASKRMRNRAFLQRRRRRRQKRRKSYTFSHKTTTLHVLHTLRYISCFPCTTTTCNFPMWRFMATWTHHDKFFFVFLNLDAATKDSPPVTFIWHFSRVEMILKEFEKSQMYVISDIFATVAVVVD